MVFIIDKGCCRTGDDPDRIGQGSGPKSDLKSGQNWLTEYDPIRKAIGSNSTRKVFGYPTGGGSNPN